MIRSCLKFIKIAVITKQAKITELNRNVATFKIADHRSSKPHKTYREKQLQNFKNKINDQSLRSSAHTLTNDR